MLKDNIKMKLRNFVIKHQTLEGFAEDRNEGRDYKYIFSKISFCIIFMAQVVIGGRYNQ